jgi:hypothetical protein
VAHRSDGNFDGNDGTQTPMITNLCDRSRMPSALLKL